MPAALSLPPQPVIRTTHWHLTNDLSVPEQRWAQPKPNPIVSELNNSETRCQLAGDTASERQEMWWGLEVPWRAMCLEVGTGQSEGGSESSKRVDCDSVMMVTPTGPREQIDLQPQHPGDRALLRSGSAPLAFHADLHECPFGKRCYMWTKVGLCSLQPNECSRNIQLYLYAITALPSPLSLLVEFLLTTDLTVKLKTNILLSQVWHLPQSRHSINACGKRCQNVWK